MGKEENGEQKETHLHREELGGGGAKESSLKCKIHLRVSNWKTYEKIDLDLAITHTSLDILTRVHSNTHLT